MDLQGQPFHFKKEAKVTFCFHHSTSFVFCDPMTIYMEEEQEGFFFSRKEEFMHGKLFSVDRCVFYIGFKDPFAALLESYF